MYYHEAETLTVDNYHIDLFKEVLKGAEVPFNEEFLSEPTIIFNGNQVIVYHSYVSGPREVDILSLVAFYIPHDGQCTLAVNHMDGLATLDNADLMFGKKED